MKKLKIAATLVVFSVITFVISGCTGTVAGGSGAGNPVTVVVLSMQAHSEAAVTAAMAKKSSDAAHPNQRKSVPVRDDSGTEFHVTSARITVAKIKFISDTGETPWFDGPFTFDAITGESEPALVTVDIPSGSYTGIMLLVTKKGINSTDDPSIELSGTFDYLNKPRDFSFALKCNLSVKYSLEAGTLELVPDEKLQLTVVLDADTWLTGTSLVECIDAGTIFLQDDGTLRINGTIPPGPCHSSENIIRQNILYSGKLDALYSGTW